MAHRSLVHKSGNKSSSSAELPGALSVIGVASLGWSSPVQTDYELFAQLMTN